MEMNSIPAPGFLQLLRSATNEQHKALEDTPLSKALLNQEVSRDQYKAYLQKMLAINLYFEKNIFPLAAAVTGDTNNRYKSQKILADLAFVPGRPIENPNDFYMPQHTHHATAYALGCMYVLEGSTLGGKFILQHIGKILSYNAFAGATYFAGYGELTGSMWKSFLEKLSGYADNYPQYQPAVLQGARESFEAIRYYFEL